MLQCVPSRANSRCGYSTHKEAHSNVSVLTMLPQEVSKQAALLAAVSALASLHQLSLSAAASAKEGGAPLQPVAPSPAASKAHVPQVSKSPTKSGEEPMAAAAAEEGTRLPPMTTATIDAQPHEPTPSAGQEEGAPPLPVAAASEALLRGACSVLSTRGALALHHGAFVKTCLGRLAGLLALLGTAPPGEVFQTPFRVKA